MRSVFFNVFQSLIVLLYVLDNETNTVIMISCFVGLGIEVWKIGKVVDVSIDHDRQFLGIFPRVMFTDKGSYEESGTKEFDRMAFKYLGWALFPLGICYIIYSVMYNEHKGWYSFVLSSCYGFLLTFGTCRDSLEFKKHRHHSLVPVETYEFFCSMQASS